MHIFSLVISVDEGFGNINAIVVEVWASRMTVQSQNTPTRKAAAPILFYDDASIILRVRGSVDKTYEGNL